MNPWILLIGVTVFSVFTLWFPYASDMWGSGHYQYFPVLIAGVAALLWSRRGEIVAGASAPRSSWVVAGLAAFGSMVMVGHLLHSGLIGIVATIFAIIVLVYGVYGWGGLIKAMPVLALLVFAVPLPLSLDQSLILRMQFLASGMASMLLDGLGFMHFREGVILITEKSQFLTEEACSGIRSLFSSLAVVSIYGVGLRHAWYRILFNVLQSVVWVLIGNSVRVAAVVVLADRVSPWFATGAGHEILGMCVFAFILAMVISTDALMWLLVYARLIDEDQEVALPSVESSPQPVLDRYPLAGFRHAAFLVVLGIVGLVGLRVAYVSGVDFAPTRVADMPPPSETDLPKTIAGWQQMSFEHQERDVASILANHSYVWSYSNGKRVAIISVDCPWTEWHNLAVCYSALGWKLDARYFIENEQTRPGEPAKSQSELTMTRGKKHGFVVFSVLDRAGAEIYPDWRMAFRSWSQIPSAILQQVLESLGFGIESQFAVAGLQLPATTIQLLTESGDPPTAEELKEIRQLYDVIREKLVAGQRWRSGQPLAAVE